MKGLVCMVVVKHDLLPKQKIRGNNLLVEVDIYELATELYDELSAIDLIERLKNIPQLGVIKVPKRMKKSRYDYTILQLYFHQLIRKKLKTKLRLTYNNLVRPCEFLDEFNIQPKNLKPTIGDLLQILTIVYNIGHFYNTFTASRAAIMISNNDFAFRDKMLKSSRNLRYQAAAEALLENRNYHRLHLLNSLLVLERCDQSKQSVLLAQELILAYLNENDLSSDSKLRYVFKIFRSVRNVSYMAYDLQIANTPFTIDLCNEAAITVLFEELLSAYNDQLPATRLITSIGKLLDDTVYNECSNAICYYLISQNISKSLYKEKDWTQKDYYSDFWLNKNSFLNTSYSHRRDYSSDAILKLTFTSEDKEIAQSLLEELTRANNIRVGSYNRQHGEQTILVAIKNKCTNKVNAAFRVLKTSIKHIRRVSVQSSSDPRYLLASKFFLYYFFNERPVVIRATVDNDICVLCTRGRKQRTSEIDNLLRKMQGNIYERHEVEFMKGILSKDGFNDTSITFPASIIALQKDSQDISLCEFDGLIIHPMRKNDQIILLEAKNTSNNPSFAKKCLSDKLDKLNIDYNKNEIKTIAYDALLKFSL